VASGWLPVGYQMASGWLQGSLRVALGSVACFFCQGEVLISGTEEEVRVWRAPSWEEIEAAQKRKEGRPQ